MDEILPKLSNLCSSNHVITLTNIKETETFCYSLPIIKGYITSFQYQPTNKQNYIILKKQHSNENEITKWPIINNNFKCLAELQVGNNDYILKYQDCQLHIKLIFQPKITDYHVLPVYIICKGDNGKFQAPKHEENSPESACRRIIIGSKLIQSLTAEKLYEADLGRTTFQLASDTNTTMDCIVFHSRLSADDVYAMEPEEIWEHFGRELMTSPYGCDKRKFLAFLSCTRYSNRPMDVEPETHDDVVARVSGHVALGGGGLAIFGTGCLHTWPQSLDQVVHRFSDETKVDKSLLMDDSCYRGTYGGCFSTTLGSVCHELGHTFDLGHSKKGIMGRGFDNINLVFTVNGQTKDANKNMITRNDAQHATVCFTRDLNVTYIMSSPIKRPRGKLQGIRRYSPKRSASTSDIIKNKTNENQNDNERRQMATSKIHVDDLTFWEKSCSVLLRYHRWFADGRILDKGMSNIEFDSQRKTITSPAGIRVVEARGDDGIVLQSWEFLGTYVPKQFTIPLQNIEMRDIKMIVAEDSEGNIVKETLITG